MQSRADFNICFPIPIKYIKGQNFKALHDWPFGKRYIRAPEASSQADGSGNGEARNFEHGLVKPQFNTRPDSGEGGIEGSGPFILFPKTSYGADLRQVAKGELKFKVLCLFLSPALP